MTEKSLAIFAISWPIVGLVTFPIMACIERDKNDINLREFVKFELICAIFGYLLIPVALYCIFQEQFSRLGNKVVIKGAKSKTNPVNGGMKG